MQRSSTANPPEARVAHLNAPEHVHSRGHGHSHSSPLRIILIALAALAIALLALAFGYGAAHDGRVYRGVSVLGANLGGMSRSEAQAALTQAAVDYPSDSLTLNDAAGKWTFTPSDLGLGVDVDKTLDAAMQVGRTGNLLDNTGRQLGVLFGGVQVTPVLKYDAKMVESAVARVAGEIDRPAVDSKLAQGPDGKVHITPSSQGLIVDREAVRVAISASLSSTPLQPVNVTKREDTPKVTEAALKSSEAQALLLTEEPVTLKAGKRSWTIEPNELRGMLALTSSEGGTWNAGLDNNALAEYLKPVADKLRVEPTDASVVVGKGTVTLKDDEDGAELDVPAAISMIQQTAARPSADERLVDLPIKSVPAAVHTDQVKPIYEKADALVTQGIRLRFGEDGYILRGASVTGFLEVEQSQGGPGAWKLVIDEDVLANRIAGVGSTYVNRPFADARFRMVGGSPTRVSRGQNGYKVEVAATMQSVMKAIESYAGGDRLQVEMTVKITEPTIKDADIASIHTPDLLGTGQTSYAGSSAERAWNVGLGAKKIDGALVPPGGVFSTVDTIGDLTLDAGFKMGYMIITTNSGVTTVPAEAGGICQVATTLFHSVFWSGLPIVERNWHSYWINSYGVGPSGLRGLDATIAPPEKDFRFKNTTGNWLLIRATGDGKTLTFKLYGVDPGWNVKVSQPVITNIVKTDPTPITEDSDKLPKGKKVMVEHAQDGFNSSISRTVTDSEGKVIDSWTARSRYVPARDRYLVGTGE
jgi:vancomycin resistance protein YoaR